MLIIGVNLKCIWYGLNGVCYAHPPIPSGGQLWKPEEEIVSSLCKTANFEMDCPRFRAMITYLRAKGESSD